MKSNEHVNKLIELGEQLGEGQGKRFVCPSCMGGSSKEKSLSVWRDRLACRATCYRATCDMGTVRFMLNGTSLLRTGNSSSLRTRRKESYEGIIKELSSGLRTFLKKEWHVGDYIYDLRVTIDGDIVIPIWDKDRVRRGDVVRQLKPYDNSRAKAMSYYSEGYCGLAWFRPNQGTPIRGLQHSGVCCVVEDPVSAMRLACWGVTGVSLLGTLVNRERLAAMREFDMIHLALDADATNAAIKAARRHSGYANLAIHRLYHDVKDMSEESLLNFLQELGV